MPGSSDTTNVHRLVLVHGHKHARESCSVRARPLVDIAAEVLADDTQRIGISYTGFCLTALPHKKLANDEPWEKKGHHVALLVEPGRLKHAAKTTLFGCPIGARARMILLYLQTQAIRYSSREVALRVLCATGWNASACTSGQQAAHALRKQAARISACPPDFFWDDAGADGLRHGAIVGSGLRFHAEDSTQGSLWEDRVVLDETFYAALRDHPVPSRSRYPPAARSLHVARHIRLAGVANCSSW